MSDIVHASGRLIDAAKELDQVSKDLAIVEENLEPLEIQFTQHVEDFIAGLWDAHIEHGDKHPPLETREALAHRMFERDRYRYLLSLRASRRRLKSRLSDLREIVAAQRSIVSAAKTELEATEGPKPQFSSGFMS